MQHTDATHGCNTQCPRLRPWWHSIVGMCACGVGWGIGAGVSVNKLVMGVCNLGTARQGYSRSSKPRLVTEHVGQLGGNVSCHGVSSASATASVPNCVTRTQQDYRRKALILSDKALFAFKCFAAVECTYLMFWCPFLIQSWIDFGCMAFTGFTRWCQVDTETANTWHNSHPTHHMTCVPRPPCVV